MNHPLDGNMIAADRHYGKGDDPHAGQPTRCCEGGKLEYIEAEDCACTDGAVCTACEDEPLRCSECGEPA